MPFELGVAYALARTDPKAEMIVFERTKRDLLKILSDLRGFDPKVRNMDGEKALATVYSSFASPDISDPEEIGKSIYATLEADLPQFRKGQSTIFNKRSFQLLVHTVKARVDSVS